MKQVYLLYGDDLFSQEKFEKKLIAEKVDPQWSSFNLSVLDVNDTGIDRIIESADSPPFGPGNKVTIVRNSENIFSQNEEQINQLLDLLEKGLMDTNFLVFFAHSIDKRKSAVKKILKFVEEREINKPKPWEVAKKLHPLIDDSFRKHGKRIEQQALQELVEATGADKQRLEKEIKKLILYAEDRNVITYDDVRNLVNNSESDIFEFLNLLAAKETGSAILQLNKLLLKEVPIKIIASVSANLRTVYNIKLLEEDRMGYNEIAKELGQRPFLVEKNLKLWRNYNAEKLRRILNDLLKIDFKFKTSAVDYKLEIEKFIIKNFC